MARGRLTTLAPDPSSGQYRFTDFTEDFMFSIIRLLTLPLLGGAPSATPTPAPLDSTAMTLVVVQNARRVPATVYLERGGEDVRLGVVGAFGDTTLRIPDYLAEGEVRFFVEPTGQLEEGTGPVDVERGTHIGLVIPAR